ncbi:MAG: sigma-70 family RNA polymerase sigma factor [Peptococcaceae bacterium]|nr:sigma-70 family RNA polymerase sigma factor [Peptococcaceae bacterium]
MRLPLQTLVEREQDSLYRAAFSMCGNRMDAEDAVQEAFVQYYMSKKEFESETHIHAWLLRVAINRAKNISRSFWRRNKCSLEEEILALSFADEDDRSLFEAVMALPEKYRVVIHLFYYEDYAVREIAQILKLSESNVKTRLSRGRNMLRQSLKEAWEDDE